MDQTEDREQDDNGLTGWLALAVGVALVLADGLRVWLMHAG